MAHIHPEGWRELAATGAARREIDTLSQLATGLPDGYTVFHGVHWTRIDQGSSVFGEIDFIVVAPDGAALLIEQKTGLLTETPAGLAKKQAGAEKPVLIEAQIAQVIATLRQRFVADGEPLRLDYLLYCPDYQVRQADAAGIAAERLVDARRRHELVAVIRALLPGGPVRAQRERVLRFFGNVLQLVPDPSTMIGQAQALVTRLAGGLATWARQLEFTPFRLRVTGTAGSGKTQLALAEFSAALAAGQVPLYVSFNRPLADHVRRLMPDGGRVASFHQLCDSFARESGETPDYANPQVWQQLEHALATAPLPPGWHYDLLIVDEGQDFSEAWRDALLRLLKPDGRALWLEDPMQNLYARDPVPLPGWVRLKSSANYRSPRAIVQLLRALPASAAAALPDIEAASPLAGADIEWLTYPHDDDAQLLQQTRQAIVRCLASGFMRSDMALVSFRGREHSQLLNLEALGNHTLHSFSGRYDLFGNPLFRDGELLAESVYRFKGQSAPAIIFSEIDLETLDERSLRKLFVGMTRARLKLVLVLSERAARLLRGAVPDPAR